MRIRPACAYVLLEGKHIYDDSIFQTSEIKTTMDVIHIHSCA